MIRPFVIQAAQFRATWLVIGLLVGTMIVASAFALSNVPRLSQPQGGQTTNTTQQHTGYGVGYPPHGGLAGPSWVQGSPWGLDGPPRAQVTEQHPGYGTGYPLHGGLAGPSSVGAGE
jgi:hypothetical protein